MEEVVAIIFLLAKEKRNNEIESRKYRWVFVNNNTKKDTFYSTNDNKN